MRFLLTNDDGIDAPGLEALVRAARGLGELRVVAPASPQSGASHSMSDRTPLKVTRGDIDHAVSAHAVHGRPADCARLGLAHYAEEADWVLSGINAGGNLGVDVYYSGTVGAAREAAIMGRPAVAISQYIRDAATLDWQRASHWAAHIIEQIVAHPQRPGLFWNVNLPHPEEGRPLAGVIVAPLAVESHLIDYHREHHDDDLSIFHYRGSYQDRPRPVGTDVEAVFGGAICVTPMSLETAGADGALPTFRTPPEEW